jgi:hypothetical protein
MMDDWTTKQKRGTYAGAALIALGLITAVIGYVNDSDSLNFDAGRNAILHAVLWTIAGAVVIGWHHLPKPD